MIQNFNAGEKPTRIRHHVLVMLFVTVVINYLDRSNLSVAATHVAGDLQIDTKHMGLLFSAFGWAYVAFQIPGGWLADMHPPATFDGARLRPVVARDVVAGIRRNFCAFIFAAAACRNV